MYLKNNFIVSPNGDVLLTVKEDHQDVCDNLKEVKKNTEGWTEERTMKLTMSVPMQEYVHWQETLGHGCWEDEGFVKWWKLHTDGKYCL